MLEWCQFHPESELLRVWEPARPFVVLGVGNEAYREVNVPACEALGIPVLRRCSGGGAVLQAKGCLNFTLVLGLQPSRLDIMDTHRRVLDCHASVLAALLKQPVTRQGTSDLALGALKFSGNAQRRKQTCVLYHGTFLLDADVELIEKVLRFPSQQPGYRAGRSHRDFLTALPLSAVQVSYALNRAWKTVPFPEEFSPEPVARWVREKYALSEWNFKR